MASTTPGYVEARWQPQSMKVLAERRSRGKAQVTVAVSIPGGAELALEHLMLDVNGTLTNRGDLIIGVRERVAALRAHLLIHLVSADTFGTLDQVASELKVSAVRASSGQDKLYELDKLGPEKCAVVGNDANDVLVLEAAALGIVVIGPEGASAAALRAADLVCMSVVEAPDVLLEPRALSATLRP